MDRKLIDGEWVTVEDLITKWDKLLHKITHKQSKRIKSHHAEKDDLYNVGVIGLMKAFERFDPEKGFAFMTYAYPLIEGEIQWYVRDKKKTIRYSRTAVEVAYRIKKENIYDWQSERIAEKLGVSIDMVNAAFQYMREIKSTDQTVYDSGEGDEITYGDTIATADDESSIYLEEFYALLPDKLERAARMMTEGYTQAEIGGVLGCSQVHVSRFKNKIKDYYLKFERGELMPKGDMAKAKELLANTDKTVNEIAKETGVLYQNVYSHAKRIRKENKPTKNNDTRTDYKSLYEGLKAKYDKLNEADAENQIKLSEKEEENQKMVERLKKVTAQLESKENRPDIEKLNEQIDDLRKEIGELNDQLIQADMDVKSTAEEAERDIKKAQETVEYYKELHAMRKIDCDCLEEQLSNLHEAHDKLREYIAASLKVV